MTAFSGKSLPKGRSRGSGAGDPRNAPQPPPISQVPRNTIPVANARLNAGGLLPGDATAPLANLDSRENVKPASHTGPILKAGGGAGARRPKDAPEVRAGKAADEGTSSGFKVTGNDSEVADEQVQYLRPSLPSYLEHLQQQHLQQQQERQLPEPTSGRRSTSNPASTASTPQASRLPNAAGARPLSSERHRKMPSEMTLEGPSARRQPPPRTPQSRGGAWTEASTFVESPAPAAAEATPEDRRRSSARTRSRVSRHKTPHLASSNTNDFDPFKVKQQARVEKVDLNANRDLRQIGRQGGGPPSPTRARAQAGPSASTRTRGASKAGGPAPSASAKRQNPEDGLANFNFKTVKKILSANKIGGERLAYLLRPKDNRLWPSEEFPGEMRMCEVFEDGDALEAISLDKAESMGLPAERSPARPPDPPAPSQEEKADARTTMMEHIRKRLEMLNQEGGAGPAAAPASIAEERAEAAAVQGQWMRGGDLYQEERSVLVNLQQQTRVPGRDREKDAIEKAAAQARAVEEAALKDKLKLHSQRAMEKERLKEAEVERRRAEEAARREAEAAAIRAAEEAVQRKLELEREREEAIVRRRQQAEQEAREAEVRAVEAAREEAEREEREAREAEERAAAEEEARWEAERAEAERCIREAMEEAARAKKEAEDARKRQEAAVKRKDAQRAKAVTIAEEKVALCRDSLRKSLEELQRLDTASPSPRPEDIDLDIDMDPEDLSPAAPAPPSPAQPGAKAAAGAGGQEAAGKGELKQFDGIRASRYHQELRTRTPKAAADGGPGGKAKPGMGKGKGEKEAEMWPSIQVAEPEGCSWARQKGSHAAGEAGAEEHGGEEAKAAAPELVGRFGEARAVKGPRDGEEAGVAPQEGSERKVAEALGAGAAGELNEGPPTPRAAQAEEESNVKEVEESPKSAAKAGGRAAVEAEVKPEPEQDMHVVELDGPEPEEPRQTKPARDKPRQAAAETAAQEPAAAGCMEGAFGGKVSPGGPGKAGAAEKRPAAAVAAAKKAASPAEQRAEPAAGLPKASAAAAREQAGQVGSAPDPPKASEGGAEGGRRQEAGDKARLAAEAAGAAEAAAEVPRGAAKQRAGEAAAAGPRGRAGKVAGPAEQRRVQIIEELKEVPGEELQNTVKNAHEEEEEEERAAAGRAQVAAGSSMQDREADGEDRDADEAGTPTVDLRPLTSEEAKKLNKGVRRISDAASWQSTIRPSVFKVSWLTTASKKASE